MSRRLLTIAALLAVAAGVLVFLPGARAEARPPKVDIEQIEGDGPLLVVHHVRDWHFVDRDLFGQDVGLEGKALDAARADHLDAVERVQAEQRPVPRRPQQAPGDETEAPARPP